MEHHESQDKREREVWRRIRTGMITPAKIAPASDREMMAEPPDLSMTYNDPWKVITDLCTECNTQTLVLAVHDPVHEFVLLCESCIAGLFTRKRTQPPPRLHRVDD